MDKENLNPNLDQMEEENDCIVLTMEDGTDRTFNFEDNFEYKGKRYLCISPAEEMDDIQMGELLIYELTNNGKDEEGMLNPIADEAMLEEVYNEYCRRYDEEMEDCDGDCDCCGGHDGEECDCGHEDCHCKD